MHGRCAKVPPPLNQPAVEGRTQGYYHSVIHVQEDTLLASYNMHTCTAHACTCTCTCIHMWGLDGLLGTACMHVR